MSQASNYDEVAKRYGLEPIPESVSRLTKLVSQQDADLDEISTIIARDKNLAARLLRAANPEAVKETDYDITTVDDAIMRKGVGCVLILAMGDPLLRAVVKTFQTMLGIKVDQVPAAMLPPITEPHIVGSIGFTGKSLGKVHLRLTKKSAKIITASMLGMKPEELGDGSEIIDVIGEVSNIVAGNFKSNLCDAGLNCILDAPTIYDTEEFRVEAKRGELFERSGFKSSSISLFVDLYVNPWG